MSQTTLHFYQKQHVALYCALLSMMITPGCICVVKCHYSQSCYIDLYSPGLILAQILIPFFLDREKNRDHYHALSQQDTSAFSERIVTHTNIFARTQGEFVSWCLDQIKIYLEFYLDNLMKTCDQVYTGIEIVIDHIIFNMSVVTIPYWSSRYRITV